MAEVGAPPITGAFADALKSRREWCNTQFAVARAGSPNLDPERFGEFLAGLGPVVLAVLAEGSDGAEKADSSDVVGRTVEALFEISLEVIAKEVAGRHPEVVEAWKSLLIALPGHLAREPRQFAGATLNALYNLATTSGARTDEWSASVRVLGERTDDPALLLEAGKVAAWRAGMAHYRLGALERCLTLPEELALAALGLPSETALGVGAIVECLRADPWLHPMSLLSSGSGKPEVRVVGRVGAFRGFGGPFLRPPTVFLADGHLAATDGEASWLICADVFGATLHRAGGPVKDQLFRFEGPLRAEADGTIRDGTAPLRLPEFASVTSAASDESTLAVTTEYSHSLYLLAKA